MLTWFKKILYDEEAFKSAGTALTRFGIAALGYLFEQNIIPTGIPDGGSKIGHALIVGALLVTQLKRNTSPAGTPTPSPVDVAPHV